MLPNYLIIGGQRCGTSALARAIGQHPSVFLAPGKEMHFFDRRFGDGVPSYEARFAAHTTESAVGEATPDYMYVGGAMAKIAATLPDVRLIAILRDPVGRAYSHYWHNQRRGREPLSFAEAIEAEPARLASMDPQEAQHFGYIARGFFAAQLAHIDTIMPSHPLLVLLNDDLRLHREALMERVWTFVDVDPVLGDPGLRERKEPLLRKLKKKVSKDGDFDRTYPPMDPAMRASLVERYHDDIATLEGRLGVDLDAWRS